MAIKKSNGLEANFCIVPNSTANAKLSWAAKGLLLYLGSKPEDWEVSIPDLIKQTEGTAKRSGRDAIKAILDELIESGHVRKLQQRTSGKFATNDYEVCLTPFTENPSTDKPLTAEPKQQSKEITNTDLTKNRAQGTVPKTQLQATPFFYIWKHIQQHIQDTYSGIELHEPSEQDIESMKWALSVNSNIVEEHVCLTFCDVVLKELKDATNVLNPFQRAMQTNIPVEIWNEWLQVTLEEMERWNLGELADG